MLDSTQQFTLAGPCTVSGIGVHSALPVNMTLHPAEADTGFVFVRTDVTDKDNVVPARYDAVVDTRMCTIIANAQGVTVSTVEHILSACAALGIDNARIDVSGPEVPIMDGSALRLIETLYRAGSKKLDAPRKLLKILKTVTVEEDGRSATLSPADNGQTRYTTHMSSPSKAIGEQSYAFDLTEAGYRREICAARSPGYFEDAKKIWEMGMAKGSGFDNALIIDGDVILNIEGERYPYEPSRHKILDAIGDMVLAGMNVLGHYESRQPGHTLNNKVLRQLFATDGAYEVVSAVDALQDRAA